MIAATLAKMRSFISVYLTFM